EPGANDSDPTEKENAKVFFLSLLKPMECTQHCHLLEHGQPLRAACLKKTDSPSPSII
ncbi:hypothetical protein STEG23_010598, partial [Scotinomys teguina]